MSKGEEENLIPAVLSDSQDYTSRLVYADWLEEQGDSEQTICDWRSSCARRNFKAKCITR